MLIARRLEAFPAAPGNAILACECAASAAGPLTAQLSIRTMRRGTEELELENRRVSLDEDAYLIVDGARVTASRYRADTPVRPFTVFFDRALLAEALADALEPQAGDADFTFLAHLRPHGDAVTARLQQIERALAARCDDDDAWFEEQLALLLHAALEAERALLRRAERIASVKPATRRELLRRVLLAADFMLSHYEQPIRLEHIADAARLSRFHLVRLFRQAQGVTPHEYLLAKRLSVAGRLLLESRCDLSEIAARSGFGTRCSLFRHLQRRLGAGGQMLRSGRTLGDAWVHRAAAHGDRPWPIAA